MVLLKVSFVVITAVILNSVVTVFWPTIDENWLEIEKCPACFGVNFCPQLVTRLVSLKPWSQFTAAFHLNAKNVYLADYLGKQVKYHVF